MNSVQTRSSRTFRQKQIPSSQIPSSSWPKRLYALDVSRGFAALSVVLWHWQHFFYTGHFLPEDFKREDQPLYRILKMFYEVGEHGVEYFFLLSGFIFFWLYRQAIADKKISARSFSVQRFSRLYPLHFFTLLIVAFLQALYFSRESQSFVYPFNDIYHFILNLGFASRWGFESGWSFNGPIWSVSIEILLYVAFFIVALCGRGKWLFCLLTSVMSFVLLKLFHHPLSWGASLFFLGGLIFYITDYIVSYKRSLCLPLYMLTISSWLCIIVHFYVVDLVEPLLSLGIFGKIFIKSFSSFILFPLTVLSIALYEINCERPVLKSASWIGDITYSSYLLHFPLQLVFALAISYGLLHKEFAFSALYLSLFFIVLIALSYWVFVKFERPMQKILRQQLTRGSNRPPKISSVPL